MKLYASAVQPDYTGPLLGGNFFATSGVVEIADSDITAKTALEVFHAFSTEKPKTAAPVKEAPKESVAK